MKLQPKTMLSTSVLRIKSDPRRFRRLLYVLRARMRRAPPKGQYHGWPTRTICRLQRTRKRDLATGATL